MSRSRSRCHQGGRGGWKNGVPECGLVRAWRCCLAGRVRRGPERTRVPCCSSGMCGLPLTHSEVSRRVRRVNESEPRTEAKIVAGCTVFVLGSASFVFLPLIHFPVAGWLLAMIVLWFGVYRVSYAWCSTRR
jgi:hypothetical protein